jgi:hypothetical protein
MCCRARGYVKNQADGSLVFVKGGLCKCMDDCYPSKSQKATGGGLFNCMDDPAGFACSLFLPCCAVGQTAANTLTIPGRIVLGSDEPNKLEITCKTACFYMCCCTCLGCQPESFLLGPPKDLTGNGYGGGAEGRGCYEYGCYNEPRPSCIVHALKWFICHPCYVSQLFRASKLALDVRTHGAPDCNKMERLASSKAIDTTSALIRNDRGIYIKNPNFGTSTEKNGAAKTDGPLLRVTAHRGKNGDKIARTPCAAAEVDEDIEHLDGIHLPKSMSIGNLTPTTTTVATLEEEDAKAPNSLQEAGSQLTKAAKKSDLGTMSRLIDVWPDCIDWQNNYGCTALHYACMGNRVEVAKMLVQRGAELNLRNKGIPGHPNHSSPKTPMEMCDAALRKQLALSR